jgi:hypothetical protein
MKEAFCFATTGVSIITPSFYGHTFKLAKKQEHELKEYLPQLSNTM